MMFKGDKYLTIGVSEKIPLIVQQFMWEAIDMMPEPKDYLQVFDLKSEGKMQVVKHTQEQPEFEKIYLLPNIENRINAKVYVIDDYYADEDKHIATMLLAEEY